MKMSGITLNCMAKTLRPKQSCAKALIRVRQPNGFQCPECGSIKTYHLESRKLFQCPHCRHQVLIIADTLFHSTKVPLVKWFWATYLMASDKGGISALRVAKHLGVTWITARNMLRKIRKAMADRDSIYRPEDMIEFDDTLVGGKRAGKRGRRAEGKRPVLVAVETREKGAGFVAMQTVNTVSKVTVRQFLGKHLKADQTVKTDALPVLNAVSETQHHRKELTPPRETAVWLPLVHRMIGNMKTFINGTFHGVSSKCLQEYLDEFCYRFNRRF